VISLNMVGTMLWGKAAPALNNPLTYHSARLVPMAHGSGESYDTFIALDGGVGCKVAGRRMRIFGAD
jgi:hypothetical protein